MRLNGLSLFLACAALAHPSSLALGDLIVDIPDVSFRSGDSGTIDVHLRSDGPAINLFNYGFKFVVEPMGGSLTQLQFVDPQSDAQLHMVNYLFAAASLKRDGDNSIPDIPILPSPIGNVTSVNGPNDTFSGSDSVAPALTGTPASVDGSGGVLVRLELQPGSGFLTPTAGELFQIRLLNDGSTAFMNDSLAPIAYSANIGTINITAVPEPSSWLPILISVLLLARLRELK